MFLGKWRRLNASAAERLYGNARIHGRGKIARLVTVCKRMIFSAAPGSLYECNATAYASPQRTNRKYLQSGQLTYYECPQATALRSAKAGRISQRKSFFGSYASHCLIHRQAFDSTFLLVLLRHQDRVTSITPRADDPCPLFLPRAVARIFSTQKRYRNASQGISGLPQALIPVDMVLLTLLCA